MYIKVVLQLAIHFKILWPVRKTFENHSKRKKEVLEIFIVIILGKTVLHVSVV